MQVGQMQLGILVCGDNHFIVRGPPPDRETALALVRHWSLIQIGATTPPALDKWQIITRAFREDLGWAVVVEGDGEISLAVRQLLAELSARGIGIANADDAVMSLLPEMIIDFDHEAIFACKGIPEAVEPDLESQETGGEQSGGRMAIEPATVVVKPLTGQK
jgi:hypothetical protein